MNERIPNFSRPPIGQTDEEKKVERESMERAQFDEQFNNPEKVTLENGDEFFLYDFIPEHLASEIPIIFCPGIMGDPYNGKETLRILYNQGRRVLWPDAPHGITSPIRKDIEHTDMEEAELRKSAAILKTIELKKFESVDVVAHSEGGINSVMAATLEPEKFRNMVLVDPAGMIGKDNIFALFLRNGHEFITSVKDQKKNPPEFAFGSAGGPARADLYLKETWRETLAEAQAISESDIREMLVHLREKGIIVSIISGIDDKLFLMDDIQKGLTAEHVDGFYSVVGGHQNIILEPTKWGKLINEALRALETKKIKDELREHSIHVDDSEDTSQKPSDNE